jgi:uncharacterized protein (DUF1330 family)
MSAIRPNTDQFAALATAAKSDDGPVVMVNLLKFKSGGGAGEYGKYGDEATRMIGETGGRIIYSGRCEQVLIGDADESWDAVVLVEYPNRQAFIDMVSRKDYNEAHKHRESGLERTIVYATAPERNITR